MRGGSPVVDARANNFDLLRLLAAVQVMAGHVAWDMGPRELLPAPLSTALGWFPGVPIFFAISGFLISLSWERSPRLRSYLRNRFLRIYPGLWACFLVTLASLWLLYPALGQGSPERLAFWVAGELSACHCYTAPALVGYGIGNPNPPLATIPVELQFYAAVPLLYVGLRLTGRRRDLWLLGLLGVALFLYQTWATLNARVGPNALLALLDETLPPHLFMFLVGVLVQRNFRRLAPALVGKPLYWLAAYLASCVALGRFGLAVGGNLMNPLSSLLLAGLVFSLAYTAPTLAERLLRRNDLSYGIYIYHFVVGNAALQLGLRGQLAIGPVVFLGTFALAACSWVLVERPALTLKTGALHPIPGRPASQPATRRRVAGGSWTRTTPPAR